MGKVENIIIEKKSTDPLVMCGSLRLVSLKLSQRVVGCQQNFYARLTQAGVIETISESGRMPTELLCAAHSGWCH